MFAKVLIAAAAALCSLVSPFVSMPGEANELAPPDTVRVCFDFACKSQNEVTLSLADWRRVSNLFLLSGNAKEERARIKDAIALMESLVGQYAPTHRDVGMNWAHEDESLNAISGQMDCIDESINTTTYLREIEKAGFLEYHRVLDRVYRKSLLYQHWAAQVEDIASGQKYVIDSWFKDNGEHPVLVKSERWHDLTLF